MRKFFVFTTTLMVLVSVEAIAQDKLSSLVSSLSTAAEQLAVYDGCVNKLNAYQKPEDKPLVAFIGGVQKEIKSNLKTIGEQNKGAVLTKLRDGKKAFKVAIDDSKFTASILCATNMSYYKGMMDSYYIYQK